MERHFVASAIIYHNGKYLLIKHPGVDKWMFPGGHLELNESPEDAVIREVIEETGYRIRVYNTNLFNYSDDIVNTLKVPFAVLEEKIEDEIKHLHIDFIYLANLTSNEIVSSEKMEKCWFTFEDAIKVCGLDNVRMLLEKANEVFEVGQYIVSAK